MAEELEYQEMEVQQVSIDSISAQDVSSVDGQIRTAKAYPRNIERVKLNITATVQDHETAMSCSYAVPRGGKDISGPSVHLANLVAQLYGNMRVQQSIVSIGEKHVISQAIAWDLETNYAVSAQIVQKITDRKGARFTEDIIVLTANSAMSKARRNAIFSVVPKPVWRAGQDAAHRFLIGDISNDEKLAAKRKDIFDKVIGDFPVSEADILGALKVSALSHVKVDELTRLLSYVQAIKDGDTTVDIVFFPNKASQETAQAASTARMSTLKERAAEKSKNEAK